MSDVMEIVQNEDGTFSAYDDTYDVVIHCETEEEQKEVIERLKSTNWIPVSERLPEEDGTYLVTFKNGIKVCMVGYGSCERTVLGYPIGHGWYSLEEAQYYAEDSIIAWMPLPKAYKEKENADM